MGFFSVRLSKEKELREKMDSLNIREDDIRESFIRSGGKGDSILIPLKYSPLKTVDS